MDQQTKNQIHYLILKTHSLTGLIPVGAFLVIHFMINSLRTVGVWPYQLSIDIINNLPFLMYVTLLMVLYVAYGYYVDNNNIKTQSDFLFSLKKWGFNTSQYNKIIKGGANRKADIVQDEIIINHIKGRNYTWCPHKPLRLDFPIVFIFKPLNYRLNSAFVMRGQYVSHISVVYIA